MDARVQSWKAFNAVGRYLEDAYGPPERMSEDMGLIVMFVYGDPGCAHEWERCVQSEFGDERNELTAKEGFDIMRAWVRLHAEYGDSTRAGSQAPRDGLAAEYERILDDSLYKAVDGSGLPVTKMWPYWLKALEAESATSAQ